MAAAFHMAGFRVWDVTMTDIVSGRIDSLDRFVGIAFVGGFSYGDVLGSAKGSYFIFAPNRTRRYVYVRELNGV